MTTVVIWIGNGKKQELNGAPNVASQIGGDTAFMRYPKSRPDGSMTVLRPTSDTSREHRR